MKKTIVTVLILMMLPAIRSVAQNPNLEKLKTYKIAFFTKRLDLSSQEAEKFWPVYNDYQNQKNKIQSERISIIKDFNQNESTLNDKQLTDIGEKIIAATVEESSIAVSFHSKLKGVLPPAKVIKFYQAEAQFKAHLINELQRSKQQARPAPRRNL